MEGSLAERSGFASISLPFLSNFTKARTSPCTPDFLASSRIFGYGAHGNVFSQEKLGIQNNLVLFRGHDYNAGHGGVIRAVDELFGSDGVVVMRSSWLVVKTSEVESSFNSLASASSK